MPVGMDAERQLLLAERQWARNPPRSHLDARDRVSPPATVNWMARVQRQAIKANIGAKTVLLDEPLRAVLTLLAEWLKRAEPEFVHVAMMWLDVISDCRWCDDGALQAILTKRVFEQLVPPDPRPASRGVPLVPVRQLAANAHGS